MKEEIKELLRQRAMLVEQICGLSFSYQHKDAVLAEVNKQLDRIDGLLDKLTD